MGKLNPKDLAEKALPVPSDAELDKIARLAEEQVLLEDEVERLTELLNIRKRDLAKVSEIDLPDAMMEVGLSSITLNNGHTILLKNNIYSSITAKNKPEAFKWLRDNGHGSLIKERVIQESVHPSTLKAFVREQLSGGKPLPLKLFSVHEVTVAVIK